MKPEKWPFKPHHITNDGEKSAKRDLNKLTGVGIISNEHLQGFETSVCVKLVNPTTIIEFSPKGKPVRTDSGLLDNARHPPCRMFRDCTRHQYCYKCDNAHAMLFFGLEKSNIATEIQKRTKDCKKIREYYPDRHMVAQFRFEQAQERGYLEYDCPLLGYRELLFPIFFEERVIAVLFAGQLCLWDKLGSVHTIQKKFFEAYPCHHEYSGYCEEGQKTQFDCLEMAVWAEHLKWIKEYPEQILSGARYRKLIGIVDRELDSLEETLRDQMELQRGRYVRKNVEQQISDFNEHLPRQQSNEGDDLKLLWQNLEARLKDLISNFAIRYAVVFGAKHVATNDKLDLLETVVHVGELSDDLASETTELPKYDLRKVPDDVYGKVITSATEEKLFDGVQGLAVDLNHYSHRVRIFPVPFSAPSPTVILIGYHDWNPGTSIENRNEGYLDTAIQSFYTVVCSALSSIFATMAQSNQEATLRIFGHEVGQLTFGLDCLRETYLSSSKELKDLPKEKADDIHRDIEGYLRQIYFLSEQANMTIAIRKPKKEEFWAFKGLLFKWKDTYRMEAKLKNLEFDILYPKPDDPERSPVYGDQMLLEQLVYNLVRNAIKYCHRGTKIQMDCRKANVLADSPHVLTVTDYGIEIEEKETPYELYCRGNNVAGEEGLGIGLPIARQIANAHGGQIEHSCELVSEFNVPLIESYLNFRFAKKNLFPHLHKELGRLRQSDRYSRIVAQYTDGRLRYSNPSPLELIKSIKKPTWKVTFSVIIPAKEAKK